MFQNIITTILTFGLWNRVTKEQNEKTFKSSWLRVAVYCVLTIFTGVFLFLSYQVSHIRNFVFVDGIRTSLVDDSLVADSIKMQINNIFRHPRNKKERDSLMNVFAKRAESDKLPLSGLMYTLFYRKDSTMPVKVYANHKEPSNKNIANNGHLYKINYFSSSVPSLFPNYYIDSTGFKFYPLTGEVGYPLYEYSRFESLYYTYQDNNYSEQFRNHLGRFGQHDEIYEGTYNLDKYPDGIIPSTRVIADREINTLNFFSAADISKCIYTIYVKSDCPLSYFGVNFDIPVDIKTFEFPADNIIFSGFNTTDPAKLDAIRNHDSYTLFVEFPTLQNMQLIRSLILTSLLTVFATLFCSNFYFCLRKIYMKRRKLSITKARQYDLGKAKIYKLIILVLYLSLLVAFAYVAYRILIEDYFIISYDNEYYNYAGLALAIVVLLLFVYFLRKKLLSIKK